MGAKVVVSFISFYGSQKGYEEQKLARVKGAGREKEKRGPSFGLRACSN